MQQKDIAHPTNSKQLETARVKLIKAAMAEGIKLKQIYAKKDQLRGYKAGQYTHAHLSRRMRKVIKR